MIAKEKIDLTEFLVKETGISKSKIKSLYKYKSIYVNNRLVPYTKEINIGDNIEIRKTSKIETNTKYDIDIIYEDDNYLVVNKPAKLLTIANNKEKELTLYHMVREYIKNKNKGNYIFIVHRLDKDTSGIVLFVKNEKLKKKLQDNWNNIAKVRGYIGVVEGIPKIKKDTLKFNLKETSTLKTYVSEYDKEPNSITEYEVIKEGSKYSLLKIFIKTGKKNQIRVSLSHIGNPIVGDKKYGRGGDPLKRLCLHANILTIHDPISNKDITFETKIPRKFTGILK